MAWSNGDHALCWQIEMTARHRVLEEASQYNGHCDDSHHNPKGLGKTSRQTAARIHVFGTFPTTVWPALYHRQGHSSVCLLTLEDGLKSNGRLQS
jgi:hypothetical protein